MMGKLILSSSTRFAISLRGNAAPMPARTAVTCRSGHVLMNIPKIRCPPALPCSRPNNTVPYTTSSRPLVRATTRAQAAWNKVAGRGSGAKSRCAQRFCEQTGKRIEESYP